MSNQIKISADTSPVKKSLLELSKQVKDLGSSKVQIFNAEDRKMIKNEMKKALSDIKSKMKDNQKEIKKLVEEQNKVVKGSEEELKIRKQIIDGYKTQARLAKEQGDMSKSLKQQGGAGGMLGMGGGGGFMGKALSMGMKVLGGAAIGTAAMGIMKGFEATSQYTAGARNRVRLGGLGVEEDNLGTPEQLAKSGLTEQDLIQRTARATAMLGRSGTSVGNEIQKAGFERSFGLEEGQMTNISASLRANMGGRGANNAQMKLQASIFATGMEDAIGPYLESATQLLASINDNGMMATDEMIQLMAEMTKDGQRTPEQLQRMFQGIDSGIKGSSGEANAFFQSAFGKAGIGNQTIGATRMAIQSGGLFGVDPAELQRRGYGGDQIKAMGGAGMFSGAQERSGAILNQFKSSLGVGKGTKMTDIKDINQIVGLSNMANSVFGTKGLEGFDSLQMLEKVQNKQMTQKQFQDELDKIKEGKDPSVKRLDKINATLAGQTDVLTSINENLMEALGKSGVRVRNQAVQAENAGLKALGTTAKSVADTGVIEGAGEKINKAMSYLADGQLGSDLYDVKESVTTYVGEKFDKLKGWLGFSKEENIPKKGKPATAGASGTSASTDPQQMSKEMVKAMASQKNDIKNKVIVNVNNKLPDGRTHSRTHK